MSRLPASLVHHLRTVLEQFGVAALTIHDIPTGRMNQHWRVVTATTTYALRRYRRTDPAEIAFELDILNEVAGAGWPVAAAIPTTTGASTVTVAGAIYALFPFLPGRPQPYDSDRYRCIKGAILARLHADLARLPARPQRPWHHCLASPEPSLRQAGYESFEHLIAPYARHNPAGGDVLRREWQETLTELEDVHASALPQCVIHSDFHTANLLFHRGRLTGLLDFDSAHRDWRVADVATALSLDCRESPDYNALSPRAVAAFLAGYDDAGALTDAERSALLPLVRMHTLGVLLGMRLHEWNLTANPRALQSIERTIHGRIPALHERSGPLRDAMRHRR